MQYLKLILHCLNVFIFFYLLSKKDMILDYLGFTNSPKKNLLIGIISARENFIQRKAIRETWAKEINDSFADIKFILGSKPCEIPVEDRIIRERCERWSPHINQDSPGVYFAVNRSTQTSNAHSGFTFSVKHQITLHQLGVFSGLNDSEEAGIYRVILYNSLSKEKVTSASFIPNSSGEFTWKSISPVVLLPGFEGELTLETTSIKPNLNSNYVLDWDKALNFLEVCNYQKYCSHALHNSTVSVGFSYFINDLAEIQDFLKDSSERYRQHREILNEIFDSLVVEEYLFNDIVYIDVIDVYSNLPEKVLKFFNWASSDDRYENILKLDDDVFLDMKRVENELRDNETWDWWSCFKENWPAPDSGKWRDRITQPRTYPKFPSGSGYLLRSYIARQLPVNAELHAGEDVSVGILLSGLKLTEKKSSSCYWSCDRTRNSLPCNAPELSAKEMYDLWDTFRDSRTIPGPLTD